MSEPQIQHLINQLYARSNACYKNGQIDEANRLDNAAFALEGWLKQGCPGSVPIRLEDLGLTLPTPEAVAAEAATGGTAAAGGTPHIGATPTALPAVPTAAQALAEQAAAGRAETPAARNHTEEIKALREEALRAESQGDYDKAATFWRRIVQLDGANVEANQKLQQRTARITSGATSRKLGELRRKAASLQIGELDEALQLARELLTSGDLDDDTYATVRDLETSSKSRRAELKAISGQIETMAMTAELRQAIQRLEEYIREGKYQIEDRDGVIRPASEVLAQYNREYENFCTQKTHEYLERAEKSLPTYPRAAESHLKQAWAEFVKAAPSVRAELQQRLSEIQDMIVRWDQAQSYVKQAAEEKSAEQRLNLYLAAQSTYPGYEDIEKRIAEAQLDAASAVVSDVKRIGNNVDYLLKKGELDAAHQKVDDALNRAKELRGKSAELDKELGRLDELRQQITRAAGIAVQVKEAKERVEGLLAKHDYKSAQEVIDSLPAELQDHGVVKVLRGQIARARGATFTLEAATRFYRAGDYEGVVALLGKADQAEVEKDLDKFQGLTDAQRESLESLRTLAQARLAFSEGVGLIEEYPLEAELRLQAARYDDPQLTAMVGEKLQEIKALKELRAMVDELLRSAGLLKQQGYWADAYTKLVEAGKLRTPRQDEAVEQLDTLRNEWKTILINRLQAISAISKEAQEIVCRVRGRALPDAPVGAPVVPDRPLPLTPDEDRLVAGVEREYHRRQADVAAKAGNWARAVACWDAYLQTDPGDAEAAMARRKALRNQTLSEASARNAGPGGQTAALDYLDEQRRRDPSLENDSDFLVELVQRALDANDFLRADIYLALLQKATGENSAVYKQYQQQVREAKAWADAFASAQASFDTRRFGLAIQSLDDVINEYPNSTAILAWRRQRDDMQRRAVNSLLENAREIERQATGLSRIEVISLYSQVIQLVGKGRYAEADQGISKARADLPSLMTQVINEAEAFSSDGRRPAEALQSADQLLARLNDFQTAVTFLEGELQSKWTRSLQDAARTLGNKRSSVEKVHRFLRQIEEALRHPDDEPSALNAEGWLRDAKREQPRAEGLTQLETSLKSVKDTRARIRQWIVDLKAAIDNEDNPDSFRKIQEAVSEIRKLDPENRYGLQNANSLEAYYDFLNRKASTLDAHESAAKEMADNYKLYTTYLSKCESHYQAYRTTHEEVIQARNRGSLEKRAETLARAIGVAQNAKKVFKDNRPGEEPKSYAADDIDTKIKDWIQEVEAAETAMTAEKEGVVQDRETRDVKDRMLLQVFARPRTSNYQTQAERLLEDIKALDPNWPELAVRQQRLNAWKATRSKGLRGLFE